MTDARRKLDALTENLWWSWDTEATALLEGIDPFRWARYRANPVAVVQDCEHIEALLRDPAFVAKLDAVHARFEAYMAGSGWCAEGSPEVAASSVCYVSMEFGLHESLRLYSGGLGVLAGDHIRSASDLGVPLLGVSLAYREGYFRQVIEQARQLAAYPQTDWSRTPIRPVTKEDGEHLLIEVPVGERTVRAAVWRLMVGRNPLYLLDADCDGNAYHDRRLTASLYGGDHRMRIEQEVLLGLGAVRVMQALGRDPGVYHLNEGHCAFVVLQLAADAKATGLSWDDAVAVARKKCVFTTHTPVPAGHDRFDWDTVDQTLGRWRDQIGVERGGFMALGRVHPHNFHEMLCMTVIALRGSRAANGVSALHGEVSREMWKDLYGGNAADAAIGHITNGVHPLFWMAPEARALFDAKLPGWRERVWDPEVWAGVDAISDGELATLRNALRGRLVDLINQRTGAGFDKSKLTIGFARRFAPYKRGWLVLSQPERLAAILEQGVQLVFAGKAHPADDPGKGIVSQVVRFAEREGFRDRVVLLEDYDMYLGRVLTSGADVWLNNPRRPMEASGTSGQKVCLNGGLNLSVLDGWWPEGFDGTNGWAIGTGEHSPDAIDDMSHDNEAVIDVADAESLYAILEQEVLPEWRDQAAWMKRVRRCIQTCSPAFSSHRMVRDYVLDMYAPAIRGE